MLLAFAGGDVVRGAVWTEILGTAARLEAPVILVVFPGKGRAGVLSARSTRLGVPGITVEADDAVALFRVAQESMVRIRMGGGPVLMECVRISAKASKRVDPVEAMRQVLLQKGAADDASIDRDATRLGARLLGALEAGRG